MTTKQQQKNQTTGYPKCQLNIKNVLPKYENFKRKIVTQRTKVQNEFNKEIEIERIEITEEKNELKETFAR